MDKSNKKSSQWGDGGIKGGNTRYDQMNINNNFEIHKTKLNDKNINTDKPFNNHIK